jgi:hypothetical protein
VAERQRPRPRTGSTLLAEEGGIEGVFRGSAGRGLGASTEGMRSKAEA